MKIIASLIIASASLALFAAPKTVELFDGKTLDGWTYYLDGNVDNSAKIFSVANGAISIKGTPFGYLRTAKKYGNFRLHVEWCYPAEAVNSGIFVLVQDGDKIWPNAVECQLMKGRTGDFVLLGGSDISEFKAPEGKPRPKFPVVKGFNPSNENPAGEWNNADIICENGKITLFVNGTLQNIGHSPNKNGYIALQSEGGKILFRNLRIVEK